MLRVVSVNINPTTSLYNNAETSATVYICRW